MMSYLMKRNTYLPILFLIRLNLLQTLLQINYCNLLPR